MSNPFTNYRRYPADHAPPLIGRDELLANMLSTLTDTHPRSMQLVAFRTMGATSILRYLAHPQGALAQPHLTQRLPNNKQLLPLYFDFTRFPGQIGIADWLWQALRQRPELHPFMEAEPSLNLIASLKQTILLAGDAGWRIVFLCDHFDRTLSQLDVSEATELHPLVDLAGFVTATERPLVLIKPDAAASLFGSHNHQVDLLPLAYRDALTLLKTAANTLPAPTEQGAEIQIDYHNLLRLTGTIPHYALRGAELWYNAVLQYKALNELSPQELLEVLRPTLLQDFTLEFVRFWNHITPEQQQCLSDLVTKDLHLAQMPDTHKRRLKGLLDKGLTVVDGRYQPMSELWAEFIRHKRDEAQTTQELTAVGSARKDLTPREAALFAYLRQRPLQVCTYDQILSDVWRSCDTAENRHILRQVIARLRLRLQKSNEGTIINHRNKGYEFRAFA